MPDATQVSNLSDGLVVVPDLYFPEGLRWHAGFLWYSDVFGRIVGRLEPTGPKTVARVEGMPSGLGWTPDGTLLVVSMTDRAIMSVASDGRVSLYADLSGVISQLANDMVVDAHGRAYVGNYGFDVDAGAAPAPTRLVRVDPDHSIHIEEPELMFPNGMVLVDGGTRLLVAETFGERVTTLSVASDGTLTDPTVLIELPPGSGPDGIAVDRQGRVWIPCAYGSRALAVTRDGHIQAEIVGQGVGVNCCAVGGEDGQTLFVAVAPIDEVEAASSPAGRIVAFDL